MTREEAITKAVRKWWHVFNREKAEIDAGRIGTLKALGRQRLFVRIVRMTFAELANDAVMRGDPLT